MQEADVTVDARGMSCPMPVLMAAKAAKGLSAGQKMLIQATDNGARSDIPAWCNQTGNELLESEEADGVLSFVVGKK